MHIESLSAAYSMNTYLLVCYSILKYNYELILMKLTHSPRLVVLTECSSIPNMFSAMIVILIQFIVYGTL